MNETTIPNTIDAVLFLIMAVSIGYLFIFAAASMRKRRYSYPIATKIYSFAVLFPAYKEDKVIESAVHSFLQQKYPKENYDVIVISDKMKEATNQLLRNLPVELLIVDFENSSKAKALNFAMDKLFDRKYDLVVILDADNTVHSDFLQQIANAYECGSTVIQTHRMAKSPNTSTAILDAVSEEINNSIFRQGHVMLGLSSALIGSGMAFDYDWFKKNIKQVSSAGEDKEIEGLLLRQRIYIDYLYDVHVYDEKTPKDEIFYNQRRRWIASQYHALVNSIMDLPEAIIHKNVDYADKIFQWMMLPRVILLGLVCIISVLLTIIDWGMSLKWWGLLFVLGLTFCMATPDYLVDKRLVKAIVKVPWLFILMFLNLFRIKGARKNFIHTNHGEH